MSFPTSVARALARAVLAAWLAWTALAPAAAQGAAEARASVALTPEEQAWIKLHPVITLAIDQGYPPLSFRRGDADGESFAGLNIDYANLVARKTGLQLRFVGSTWDQALQKAMAHEVDCLPGARERPERKLRLNFTTPYLELPIAMATRPNHAEVRTLADFARQRVAVVKNTVRIPVIRARCPDCVVVEVDSPKEGVARVANNEVDAFFEDLPVAQRLIGEAGGTLKIALLYYYSEAATVRFALRNDQPPLLTIFNKALAAIRPEEHQLIAARWMTAAQGARVQRDLPLSASQRGWLDQHPVLRVGLDAARAPIEWRGEDGRPRGIAVEFLHRLEELLGVQFELVVLPGVPELLQAARRKEVDLLASVAPTPGREGFLQVSDPYLSSPVVIYTLAGAPSPGGLAGLAGKRVALFAQTNVDGRMRQEWPGITRVPVRDFRSAVELLRKGGADAYVGALLTGAHQLMELGASDIRVAGETDYHYQFGMGVRADWPELLPMINMALAAIPKSERDGFRQKWSTIHYVHDVDYRPLGALLLTVLVAVAFIFQLRVMVRRRTVQLQQEVGVRRAREDEIRALNEALERRVEARTAELRRANEDLQLASNRLVQTEKVASLGRLVAGIAHELNTPLGNTLTAATLLKDSVASFGSGLAAGQLRRSSADQFVEQCGQICAIIERNSTRAAGLIDNFKELSVDQTSMRQRRFRLRDSVEEVVLKHHNVFKQTPHRIELDIDEELELDSFPGPLAQVLSNLLENSLVHGFSPERPGTVRIGASVSGAYVRLSYADDGAGIAPAHLQKIYDPFFTTRLGQGGSGLGLYIVQTLVSGVLGGTIVAHSVAGQGTRFDITLLRCPPLADGGGDDALARAAAQ